jgi:nucleotide-binding universal stress UspA family protein
MFNRVVVPLDGSPLAEQALARGIDLANMLRVPMLLVRVVDVTMLDRYGAYGLAAEYTAVGALAAEEQKAADEYLADIVARVQRDLEQPVAVRVVTGAAARAIVEAATPDDVIVMASHGRTGVKRWFLGSVAEDVMRRAESPVLLIRAGEEAAS